MGFVPLLESTIQTMDPRHTKIGETMKTIIAAIALLSLATISCDQGTVPLTSLGRFEYTAYDSLGNRVAQGCLRISAGDSTSLNGTWRIEAVGAPTNIGPQIGEGTLSGFVANDQLFVELNPEFRDNNVGLSGTFDGTKFEGTWTYSGFPGVINFGAFTAVRHAER